MCIRDRTLGIKAAEALRMAFSSPQVQRHIREAQEPAALAAVLGALNLEQLGEKRIEAVVRCFRRGSELLAASAKDLAAVELGTSSVKRTLGQEAAKSLRVFLDDPGNLTLIARLEKAGVLMSAGSSAATGAAVGKIFVITGTLPSMGRAEAKKIIENAGGIVVDAISRKVDYLVVGADPGSKVAKAQELGIKQIDEAEMLRLCRGGR